MTVTPKTFSLTSPPAFHLMVKPTGAICNLDCHYCFYLAKEMLYPGSRFRMADELLELYIKQLLESHRTSEIMLAWQGGEPTLMGLDFFKLAVKYAQKHKHPEHNITYTIQTNGTRLTDEWCSFFKQHNFLVGLSLDGPRKLHDVYRVTKQGQGSFDQVMQGWQCLNHYGVEFNILCTVNAANVEHPLAVYRFFRDELKACFLQFIPIVEQCSNEIVSSEQGKPKVVSDHSVGSEQYGKFLIEIFEEWVRRDVGTVFVQHFDVALANWLRIPPAVCIFSETCGLALALEHNGDLYSCDHFVEPQYKLGNIKETHMRELVSSPQQQQFGQAKRDTLPQYCRTCEVRFACHGGCPKNRFTQTPDGEPGLNYLCAGYKAFFQHIDKPMQIMANLLRHRRTATEIMQWYAMQDAK